LYKLIKALIEGRLMIVVVGRYKLIKFLVVRSGQGLEGGVFTFRKSWVKESGAAGATSLGHASP
jgi:hypothetical protein